MLRAAAEGIKASAARPTLGDKTLLDALIPMTDAIDEAARRTGSRRPRSRPSGRRHRAREAAEATNAMQAKRGRASYTGERSIGSPDAGAMALAVMAERIAENWPAVMIAAEVARATQDTTANTVNHRPAVQRPWKESRHEEVRQRPAASSSRRCCRGSPWPTPTR